MDDYCISDLKYTAIRLPVILVFGIVVFGSIYYTQTYLPRSYKLVDPEFWVDSAAMSQLNFTTTDDRNYEITASWNLTLLVKNPNQMLGMHYANIQAMLYYRHSGPFFKHILAGKTASPPFFLCTRNQTALQLEFISENAYARQDAAQAFLQDNVAGEAPSTARFGLSLFVWYRYDTHVWGLRSTTFQWIICEPIDFGFIYDDSRIGNLTAAQSIKCEYHYFSPRLEGAFQLREH